MKRDWSKPNLRDAYKPLPQAFDQAVSATLQSLKAAEESKHHLSKRTAVFAILCALLLGLTVAYAVTRPAILNWLLGYGEANNALERSVQSTASCMTDTSLLSPMSWKTIRRISPSW